MIKSLRSELPKYQKNFLDGWLNSPSQYVAMLWPAGAGAVGTICELLANVGRESRVLTIADRQELVQQFAYRQQSLGIDTIIVDRFKYRQLQSESKSESTQWSEGQVFALTSSLASQADVALALQQQSWDIVVFIDTSSKTTAKILNELSIRSARVVWKVRTGFVPPLVRKGEWAIDRVTVNEISRDRGIPEGEGPSIAVKVLSVTLTTPELELTSLISDLTSSARGTAAERLTTSMEARRASSPAALESGLRRLDSELSTEWPLWNNSDEEYEIASSRRFNSAHSNDIDALRKMVRRSLNALDELTNDSKLEKLLVALEERDGHQSIGIFVRFRDTGKYLQAALEDRGLRCVLVHGAMSASEIHEKVLNFLDSPGQLLIMTTAMVVGSDLRNVRKCVLYDAPASRATMSQLLGKFHLIGLPQLQVTIIGENQTEARTKALIERAVRYVV
ncbi:hypothetical protein ABIC89_003088 [Variovorax boronicumulans]|uniref:helicase-related protein n=1 Tax=Variovorax boronicumulans TaxID=436515 RepID=UPI003398B04A